MDKSIQITLIVAATVLIVTLIGYMAFTQILPPSDTVNANGIAELKTLPDLVAVYLTVETNGTTATDAKDRNAEIADNVITELLKIGLERKDIATQGYNIYEDFTWTDEGRKSMGWKASHQLRIELKSSDIDKAGSVIDAGVNAGAIVNYINFELSVDKQNEYKAQALTAATQDARIKAEAIATGLNKHLGKVVSVSSLDFGYRPWMLYEGGGIMATASEAKSAVTNIQPGEQSVSASVSVTYKLV
jgi:uncharacterized protein YggE